MDAKFKKIGIEDKKLFDEYLGKYPQLVSEFTFTNLFAWQKSGGYEYAIYNNHLVITFTQKEVRKFYQPVGPSPETIIAEILNKHKESVFERVENHIAQKLKDRFKVEHEREMDDYIYLAENLRTLKGNKYEPKRNLIKQCETYSPEVCALDEGTISNFFHLQEKWCDMHECDKDHELKKEDAAIKEALMHYRQLNLSGICITINGKIEAFALGEPLNKDTYVEHFEKANTQFKGLYPYLLHKFIHSIPREFRYVNREQDLGIQGIRKSKLSYHPLHLIEKYRVSAP